ncbi:protein DPCD-like [Amphiura filiformis]|uniref:protein DPCD-like n=1 Tax=Amphiura filiformis TaxID=82378 RepID=UPI003B214BE2
MASSDAWLERLKSAKKTALIQDGRRKVHFVFTDGAEMAEEYDVKSKELLVRKWRRKGMLGGEGRWDYEVGESLMRTAAQLEAQGFMESNNNPIFLRKDTRQAFQWRIRNLPYPIETYSVTINSEDRCCIVRTTNKKYYKKYTIPDMDRAQLPLEQNAISLAHANNTLIIQYKKPKAILEMERLVQQELDKLKAAKDGDVECSPS